MPNKRRRSKKTNNRRGAHTQQQLLNKQIDRPIFRLVDLFYNAVDDTADLNIDIYTLLNSSSDFADVKENFGEIMLQFIQVRGVPRHAYTTTVTDYALGAVALRQGPYDVVTTYSVTQVLAMPGSYLLNNYMTFVLPEMKIAQKQFLPSNISNNTSSSFPKLNLFFGWQTNASTNTGNLCLHIKVGILCKSRIGF